VADELLSHPAEYEERIDDAFDYLIFNHGKAADVGAKYILSRLVGNKKN
jgi:hypothetical protein